MSGQIDTDERVIRPLPSIKALCLRTIAGGLSEVQDVILISEMLMPSHGTLTRSGGTGPACVDTGHLSADFSTILDSYSLGRFLGFFRLHRLYDCILTFFSYANQ